MAKSTVHRLAATLAAEGLLEQDRETEKYRLGIALFRLGALVRRRMDISSQGRPYLYELREKTNETVHLAILDGTEIMYVYNLESTQAIRMRSDLGVRKPAYCTAEGQAILAFQPQAVVDAVIAQGLSPRTPQTITDPAKLIKALAVVRQRGCAIEDEESEIGMRGISAPIRNDAGEVVAAVGLAGPVTRLSKKAITTFVPHVIETADLVSRRLGYRSRGRSCGGEGGALKRRDFRLAAAARLMQEGKRWAATGRLERRVSKKNIEGGSSWPSMMAILT